MLQQINEQSILEHMTVLMGSDDRSFIVFEWEQRQNFTGWITAAGTAITARHLAADPGVLSRSNMGVQGCLCTQVLGDYLLKVIWDHGVPLIIPESIQHLHLLCSVHRSTSKTKAASAGKR